MLAPGLSAEAPRLSLVVWVIIMVIMAGLLWAVWIIMLAGSFLEGSAWFLVFVARSVRKRRVRPFGVSLRGGELVLRRSAMNIIIDCRRLANN